MAFGVLLAAGSSERFASSMRGVRVDANQNKLFCELIPGLAVWRRSFEMLRTHPMISGVGIVARKEDFEKFSECDPDFLVEGGTSRCESSLAGVKASPDSESVVVIHDAARPFLSSGLISRVVRAAEECGAAIPALRIMDSVKRGDEFVDSHVERSGLYRAQTPQAARREWLLCALNETTDAGDDAEALRLAGYRVAMVEGERLNEKITTYEDLKLFSSLAVRQTPILGFGYDVHRFSDDAERKLMLGGVWFEGCRGLAGHSDADVILHALVDALLGCVGAGDIGMLFPDSDEKWKDAESAIFLREALARFCASGAQISNVDLTLIAEEPRLGERRGQICQRIARELRIAKNQVNLKATTHERIGALGRGEGIAALAAVAGFKNSFENEEV